MFGSVSISTSSQTPKKELPSFRYDIGAAPQTKAATTPLEVFQLFFTNIILECIVTRTLLFASQKGVQMDLVRSRLDGVCWNEHSYKDVMSPPNKRPLVNQPNFIHAMVTLNNGFCFLQYYDASTWWTPLYRHQRKENKDMILFLK